MVLSILVSWYIIFSLTRQMQMLRYLFYNRLPLLRCRCRMPAWLIRQLLVRLCKNCRDKRPEKQPIRKQYSILIIKVVMTFCLGYYILNMANRFKTFTIITWLTFFKTLILCWVTSPRSIWTRSGPFLSESALDSLFDIISLDTAVWCEFEESGILIWNYSIRNGFVHSKMPAVICKYWETYSFLSQVEMYYG